jgi:prevent-host-death family protein
MPDFTTSDLSRRSGDIIAEAMRRPVTITQRRKPRFVLLNFEDYEALRASADTRRAYLLAEFPEELLEGAEEAIAAYMREGDEA